MEKLTYWWHRKITAHTFHLTIDSQHIWTLGYIKRLSGNLGGCGTMRGNERNRREYNGENTSMGGE